MQNKKQHDHWPVIERDLSWMYFNHRILLEALKENVPLLEKLSFLGIYSNNLDEFFRVRIATLAKIADSKEIVSKKECETAQKTIKQINSLNKIYSKECAKAFLEVQEALRKESILLINNHELNDGQKDYILKFFRERIQGTILPIWLSGIERLTDESDEDIYLAVKCTKEQKEDSDNKRQKKAKNDYALIKLPVKAQGRFIRLPDEDGKHYLIYLDDAVRFCLPWIFAGMKYSSFSSYTFKFTKDAEMELDNDLDSGRMNRVAMGVKSRKRGEPLRVVYDATMPKDLLKKVMGKLNITQLDTVVAGGRYHNNKDLMSFPDCGRDDLKYPKWIPAHVPEFSDTTSVLDVIHDHDMLVHVPYQSFDAYLKFLAEAAINPKVKSIKTTIYRLAKESKVAETLIAAAKNGKKVTVVIELLARFDESNNISWSKKFSDAGIKVIFGVEGLKVHCKLTLVETISCSYAVIGTGNFHEGNAKTYTDCLLFTAAKALTSDVKRVFDFIKQPYMETKFNELLVSPNYMKKKLVSLINEEIKNRRLGREAWIKIKVNHLTDPTIVDRLYSAATEGVKIDMVVRGNCTMITSLPEFGGNISIHGIIDRYLEHSRIYIFCHGGEKKVYIGSADMMPRNLDNRIEVLTPIYNETIKERVCKIVELGLEDTVSSSIVDGSGKNEPWMPKEGEVPIRSQEEIHNIINDIK